MHAAAPRPYALVAELTYACPLRCAYCSNPRDFARRRACLDTAQWGEVFRQAEELGVLTLNLSGGEPLLRADLEELVARASKLGLYVNLITSGVPLERQRLCALKEAGLASIQVSFQDVDAGAACAIAGVDYLEQKRRVAGWASELELPLTVNIVLHRHNITRSAEFIALATELGAQRLELANAQYLGWALHNRDSLLPTASQIERARQVCAAARARLAGRMELLFVMPDYFSGRPRACMDGWARRYMVIAADGLVLPCHAAASIPGLEFERVGARPLAAIWRSSAALNTFRGEGWMSKTCSSCERRALDFGGCRCQAYALTGDASATDPACRLSPAHALIKDASSGARSGLIVLRHAR